MNNIICIIAVNFRNMLLMWNFHVCSKKKGPWTSMDGSMDRYGPVWTVEYHKNHVMHYSTAKRFHKAP